MTTTRYAQTHSTGHLEVHVMLSQGALLVRRCMLRQQVKI
jgi:hypothetical protein